MPLHLLTPPTEEPITLEAAKLHLRVDHDDEDAYIERLIVAAREWAENVQKRALTRRTYELTLDKWPNRREIRIPMPPLVEVESVVYTREDGTEHPLPPESYIVDDRSAPGRIVLRRGHTWPHGNLIEANGVSITYVAGYAETPGPTREALLLLIGHWYEHRQAVEIGRVATLAVEVPMGVMDLLNQDRIRLGDYR